MVRMRASSLWVRSGEITSPRTEKMSHVVTMFNVSAVRPEFAAEKKPDKIYDLNNNLRTK